MIRRSCRDVKRNREWRRWQQPHPGQRRAQLTSDVEVLTIGTCQVRLGLWCLDVCKRR